MTISLSIDDAVMSKNVQESIFSDPSSLQDGVADRLRRGLSWEAIGRELGRDPLEIRQEFIVSKNIIQAWTDGGCRGNPGPGAWAFVMVSGSHAIQCAGFDAATTNNRMEVQAAIEALKILKKPVSVLIQSDSEYLIKCCRDYLPGWKAKGWRKKGGPIKNLDQFQELDALLDRHEVWWSWVRGHSGDPGNERCDALANHAMDQRVPLCIRSTDGIENLIFPAKRQAH